MRPGTDRAALVLRSPSSAGPTRPLAHRVVLLLVFWCSTGWFLLRLGGTALGVPLGSTDALQAWLERTDPAVVAAAALRLVALALCSYLAAATALLLLTSLARWRPAAMSTGRLMPPMLRRMVVGTAGVGLTSTIISPTLAAAPPERDAARTAVMVKLEPAGPDPATGSGSTTTTQPSSTSTPTSTAPQPSESATTTAPASVPTPAPPDHTSEAPGAAHGQPPETTPEGTWVVQPGDSFWSIAEEIVAEQLGSSGTSSPADTDIARYWRTLVEANRDRLADQANPDLLFPGQELRLPEGP